MAARHAVPASVLAEVAAGGAADAGVADVTLLGDFLDALTRAVTAGKPLSRRQMATYQAIGDTAARQGVALRALLDLYLSAAWRLWPHLPPVVDAANDPQAVVVAGEVMLHAVDDAVAALAEGYQLARRALVRVEESARREFIDDLLNGGADVNGVLTRAASYGLQLSGPHVVALVDTEHPVTDGSPVIGAIERAIQGIKADADALVTSKQGRLVLVFPAPDDTAVEQVLSRLAKVLNAHSATAGRPKATSSQRERQAGLGRWQVGVGRAGAGTSGAVSSYQQAREALELAARIQLSAPIVHARDLLVYNVLLRDRRAILDLADSLLSPLHTARGDAQPLIETLISYFATGGNAARTARDMHLSVRAVTYRLSRVRELTGVDPTDPHSRLSLHVAALGAKLIDWPVTPKG